MNAHGLRQNTPLIFKKGASILHSTNARHVHWSVDRPSHSLFEIRRATEKILAGFEIAQRIWHFIVQEKFVSFIFILNWAWGFRSNFFLIINFILLIDWMETKLFETHQSMWSVTGLLWMFSGPKSVCFEMFTF